MCVYVYIYIYIYNFNYIHTSITTKRACTAIKLFSVQLSCEGVLHSPNTVDFQNQWTLLVKLKAICQTGCTSSVLMAFHPTYFPCTTREILGPIISLIHEQHPNCCNILIFVCIWEWYKVIKCMVSFLLRQIRASARSWLVFFFH